MPNNDNLDLEFNVNGDGERSIERIKAKLRDLGTTAEYASSKQVSGANNALAKYKLEADILDEIAQKEARVARAAAQTKASANRATASNASTAATASTAGAQQRVIQGLREQERVGQAIAAQEQRAAAAAIRAEQQRGRAVQDRQRNERTAALTAERQANAIRAGALTSGPRGLGERSNAINAERTASSRDVEQTNALRYALYDTAQTATLVGTAITGIGAAAVVAAAQGEQGFADLSAKFDDSEGSLAGLNESLLQLSTKSPANLSEVVGVAQLGAQMNIAKDDLDDFTRVITQFSATTNVTSEQAAESFGKIAQLLDVPTGDFDKLSSSIFQVGVDSVATESQILKTSEEIAGSAAAYNFTAEQVVGLSGAFASLAIQPEQARGATTRVFNKIESAVQSGGPKLENYARILGVTQEQASTLWKTDPGEFFSKLIHGLADSSDRLKDLKSIGATGVYDTNVLTRLASNADFVSTSLATSKKAYDEGTASSIAYAKTTDTTIARLKELGNSLVALGVRAGGGLLEGLKPVIDLIKGLVDGFASLPAPVLATLAGITILLGGIILFYGGLATATAAVIGLRYVLAQLTTTGAAAGLSMRGLAIQMGLLAGSAGINTAAFTTWRGAMTAAGGAAVGLLRSLGPLLALSAVVALTAGAIDQYNHYFADGATKTQTWLGALDGLSGALSKDTEEYEKSGDAVTTYQAGTTKMSDSQKDAAAKASNLASVLGDEVVANSDAATASARRQTIAWGETATAYVRAQLQQSDEFKNSAVTSDSFTNVFSKIGGDTDKAIEAAAKNGEEGVRKYFFRISKAALDQGKITESEFKQINLAGGSAMGSTSELQAGVSAYTSALSGLSDEARKAANANSILGGATEDAGAKAKQTADQTDTLTGATTRLSVAAYGAVGDFSSFSNAADGATSALDAARAQVDDLFSSISAGASLGDSIQTLFSGIYDAGNAFGYLSDTGRTNLANLQDALAQTAAYGTTVGLSATDSVALLFAQLQKAGVDTAGLLQLIASNPVMFQGDIDLSAAIEKSKAFAAGGAGTSQALSSMGGNAENLNKMLSKLSVSAPRAATGIKKTKKAATEAAKEVKTLNDYASDLNNVFSDARQYRFGVQDALDDVSKKWQDIQKEIDDNNEKLKEHKKDIADARDELAKYRADLAGLQAQLSQQKYFLSIAIQYGDNLRGQEITANIADLQSQIADKQKDVNQAQKDSTAPFEATTRSVLDQRDSLGDLYESYEKIIVEYARSGATQEQLRAKVDQLRADFVRQATQAGYSRAEIDRYSGAFRDMTVAINGVPRKITVDANADPAKRALADFLAQANKARANPKIDDPDSSSRGYQNGVDYANGWVSGSSAARRLVTVADNNLPGGKKYQYYDAHGRPAGGAFFNKGGFVPGKTGFPIGGFVPGPKPSDRRIDNMRGMLPNGGIIGLQGGEPVINNAARSKYGDAMFDQINALRFQPQSFSPTVVVQQGGGSDYTELSPTDRAILQEIANRVGISIGANALEKAVGAANTASARRRAG